MPLVYRNTRGARVHHAGARAILAQVPADVSAAVLSNTHLSSDYNVLALAAPEIAERVASGQFVMVKPANSSGPLLRRPFSVFEVLKDEEKVVGFSLLSKRIGPSTAALFDARPGDYVQCLGPLGRPFAVVNAPDEAWLVAGGVGLAPFATLAESLRLRNVRTRLYYGARRAAELFYLDVFERMGVDLVAATEDGSRGARGRITLPLERDLTARVERSRLMIYACGPDPMLAAVAKLAAAFGQPCQVSVERVMGCGVGGCYSCVIPVKAETGGWHYVRSCLAGPVFRTHEVLW